MIVIAAERLIATQIATGATVAAVGLRAPTETNMVEYPMMMRMGRRKMRLMRMMRRRKRRKGK
jgi:hypothetical protein